MYSSDEPHKCLFDTICRTCLAKENLVSIFTEKDEFQPLRLADVLMECTSIEVTEDDHMPLKLCQCCIDQLSQAFAFRQKCLQADLMLKTTPCENFEDIEIGSNEEPTVLRLETLPTDLKNDCTVIIEEHTDLNSCLDDVAYIHDENNYTVLLNNEGHSIDGSSFQLQRDEGEGTFEYIEIKQEYDSEQEGYLSEPEYRCEECGDEFKLVSECIDHKRTSHGMKYLCNVCGKTFYRPIRLKRHLELHLDSNVCQCLKCDETFVSNADYKQHMKEQHSPKCSLCEKIFVSKYHLQRHIIRSHKDDMKCLYPCEYCDAAFDSQMKLRDHMLIHNDNKSRICDLCGLKISLNNVQRHRQTHTGFKRHECDICGMKFIQRPTLTEHRAKHAGKTPFTCVRCRQSFDFAEDLRAHMENHPDRVKAMEFYNKDKSNKVLKCKFCPKEYRSYLGLQHHVRAHHTNERPFLCSICGKSFTQDCQLKAHTLTHTGEKPHVCNLCLKRFTQRAHLVSHMLLHTGEKPYECNYCLKRFRHLTTLRDHTKIHTGDPNKRKRIKHPKPKNTEPKLDIKVEIKSD